jgi:hypothetical protein
MAAAVAVVGDLCIPELNELQLTENARDLAFSIYEHAR